MPRHPIASLILAVLLVLTSIQLMGCTAIGFGIGSLVDVSHGKGNANRLATVRTGSRVTMWLHDGRKLHGQFLGSRDSVSDTPLSAQSIRVDRSTGPLSAVLLLATTTGVEQIPVENVKRVSVPSSSGKVVGLFTGLATDALLVGLLLLALSQVDFS